MRSNVSSAACFKAVQVVVSEADASLIDLSTSPTASAKSVIAASIALRRRWRLVLPLPDAKSWRLPHQN